MIVRGTTTADRQRHPPTGFRSFDPRFGGFAAHIHPTATAFQRGFAYDALGQVLAVSEAVNASAASPFSR